MNDKHPPSSLRILVVADVDLRSASRLAELSLHDSDFNKNPGIDLCVAIGPFTDLKDQQRSREEDAACEGNMTGAISQLENIVCRVVFVPGFSDPPATIRPKDERTTTTTTTNQQRKQKQHHRRLTPNSRNLQMCWLNMAPGLGCTGITEVKSDDVAILAIERLLEIPPPGSRSVLLTHFYPRQYYDDSDDDKREEEEDFSWHKAWPIACREIIDSETGQNKLLLHIAYSPEVPKMEGWRGVVKVICPGSLRRGDFAIVDLVLDTSNENDVRWRVADVKFKSI